MKQEPILYGIIGLLAGALITVAVASNAVNSNNAGMMRMMGMRSGGPMMMSGAGGMDQMMEGMMGKTGQDLEQSFLEAMIVHHQGAITMAQEVKQGTNRPELAKLANDIISAQTKEIETMRLWLNSWW